MKMMIPRSFLLFSSLLKPAPFAVSLLLFLITAFTNSNAATYSHYGGMSG